MSHSRQQLIGTVEFARTCARLAWFASTVALLAIIVIPHLLPLLGREVYVVRGASMEPAIPIGSIVVVGDVDPARVQIGQVITFRLDNGTVVTHRVTGTTAANGLAFTTKGDNSSAPDPTPIPATAVVGGVELAVPAVGSIIAALSTAAGEVLVLAFLGGLLLAAWFFDELLMTLRRSPEARVVARAAD